VIKEILIYVIVGVSSLLIMTFVVHMFVEGMVSPETEATIQWVVAGVLVTLFALAAWDVVRRRRRKK
jgi:putative flippase GtrA